VIVADEFRDGNVPAGAGNRRVVEKALAALPGGIAKIYLRADGTLYEHKLMRSLDDKAIGCAISADMRLIPRHAKSLGTKRVLPVIGGFRVASAPRMRRRR